MNNAVNVQVASTREEIDACYSLMAELRPQLQKKDFAQTIQHLMESQGFRLVYLHDQAIKAVAGYRIGEWLHSGRYLEIEDLVTAGGSRSKGYGSALFDWLCKEASRNECRQLRLVSGVKRTNAHRFYERKGMTFEARYYSMNIQR